MSATSICKTEITKVYEHSHSNEDDLIAAEEPLEIQLVYFVDNQPIKKNISVTMRTPGNDKELVVGFLFTEGIIKSADQINLSNSFSHAASSENTVQIVLKEEVFVDLEKLERHFYTTSSCGVCGKSSIEAIKTVITPSENGPDIRIPYNLFYKLPAILQKQQEVFQSTGGLHASALFDLEGNFLVLREDVGRHNALDKLIGKMSLDVHLPLNKHILLLSGRASFELIQKAATAGIKVVAAIGAPSSLAVSLAQDCDMTLLGFLKDNRYNLYSGKQRVIL